MYSTEPETIYVRQYMYDRKLLRCVSLIIDALLTDLIFLDYYNIHLKSINK
jgi:hypothetical protein